MLTITADDRARASRLGPRVELLDLRLRAINCELPEIPPEPPDDAEIEFNVGWTTSEPVVTYTVGCKLDIGQRHPETERGQFYADIAFTLAYKLESMEDVEEVDLAAFGRVSALFAAYPYIRELLQSLTCRVGIAPLVLSVLTLPVARND